MPPPPGLSNFLVLFSLQEFDTSVGLSVRINCFLILALEIQFFFKLFFYKELLFSLGVLFIGRVLS